MPPALSSTPLVFSPGKPGKNFINLEKWLLRQIGKAIADYNMIGAGDTVMVCVSGGKDSLTLLSCLLALRERAPVDFRIVAMNLNQRQPGFPEDTLPAYFEKIGVEYRIVTEDTYSIVKNKIPEGKTTCSLCSRLRRGIIYRTARKIGATRIALGHHRDDALETLFLNMFFGGKIKAMPPKLRSDDGRHIVIRPLAYCSEADIARYARAKEFPIIPCHLCGGQENSQRRQIKTMLQEWAKCHPGRIESLVTSLRNVVPSHLGDNLLFDFACLEQKAATPEHAASAILGIHDEMSGAGTHKAEDFSGSYREIPGQEAGRIQNEDKEGFAASGEYIPLAYIRKTAYSNQD